MEIKELYLRASESIVEADEAAAMEILKEAQIKGIDLLDLLLNGFSAGNNRLGEKFDLGIISLPELIYAAEVMRDITDNILDLLDTKDRKKYAEDKGVVILATVAGDIHDIGKGIVASTLRGAGFHVIDLGCEVPVETILQKAIEYDADIIGTSALLTSTLSEQKKLEKILVEGEYKDKFITMVGGAPCTRRWARKIGADAYSEDAIDAARTAAELIKERRTEKDEKQDDQNR